VGRDTNLTRRKVLASGAIGIGGNLLPTDTLQLKTKTVESPDKIPKGEVRYKRKLVDVKVENDLDVPDESEAPQVTADGSPPVKQSGDRLFVVAMPHSAIIDDSDIIRRSPDGIDTMSESGSYETRNVYSSTSYNGTGPLMLSLGEQYQHPAFEIKSAGQNIKVRRSDGSENGQSGFSKPVKPGETYTDELAEQTVELPKFGDVIEKEFERPDTTITRGVRQVVDTIETSISPTLNIKNHGKMNVYSAKNAIIGPEDAGWMQPVIHTAEQDDWKIHDVTGTDLVLIRRVN